MTATGHYEVTIPFILEELAIPDDNAPWLKLGSIALDVSLSISSDGFWEISEIRGLGCTPNPNPDPGPWSELSLMAKLHGLLEAELLKDERFLNAVDAAIAAATQPLAAE